jgi:hypothetical protein
MDEKRIFLKFERVSEGEVKLEFSFKRDEEKYVYIMGIASTPVENSALLDAWAECKGKNKNVAVYEKHDKPVGKVVACEEMSGKVLVVLEIPKSGNERLLAVYEQEIYTGLSIGGWTLGGEWDEDEEVFHVKEFEWIEVSLTDVPSNESALLLEFAKSQKPKKPMVEKQPEQNLENTIINILGKVTEKIRGTN